ncbi:MAG: ABC transporter permease [Salinibacterium sp.]|nr:MAG: ABC transporter permease [Salinibacterium sp.]
MKQFIQGTGVVLELELRQRMRAVAWYVLIGVFVVLVIIVTVLSDLAYQGFAQGTDDEGGLVFSIVIYFVLLLGTLVAPALSGNAINGDRDAGTLATTQVTLVSTWQLLTGKFLAAWVMALTFLIAATPCLIFAAWRGGLGADTVVVSILVLAFELGVVAAIGVGLSALISRPLFSIVLAYLAVAAISIGTLIAFMLGGAATQVTVTYKYYSASDYNSEGVGTNCATAPEVSRQQAGRFDLFWGALVANPYVILGDAVPSHYNRDGYPTDLFGEIKYGVRSAQVAPKTEVSYSDCEEITDEGPNLKKLEKTTSPGWPVGLTIHALLAGGALIGAWARIKTPAGRLTRGSRVA